MGTVTIVAYAQFTASKDGKDGLTVTWDCDRTTRSNGSVTALETDANTNLVSIGRNGLYGHYITGADLDLYDYVFAAKTADTSVDLKKVPALWTYWIADIGDAAIASVTGAVGSVTGAVGSVTGAVGSVTGAVGSVTGNVGGNVAGSVGSVTSPVTAGTVSDKTGYALTAAYDAAKTAAAPGASMVAGSLAAQAQTDVQTALTGQGYTTTRAGYLDTLNGLVSAIWAAATRTLTSFGFSVTVGTNNDKSGYSLAAAPPTSAAIAGAVWDEALSGHATTGSAGKTLATAGSASDPLLNTVPGSYASGSAGAALGRIGSGQITTVSPVSQSGTCEVVRGMDYSATDGLALDWTFSANPDLTGATVAFYIYSGSSLEATWTPTVITPTAGAGKVRLQPTNTQTGVLRETAYAFSIWATLSNTHKVQLYAGTLVVLPELRP